MLKNAGAKGQLSHRIATNHLVDSEHWPMRGDEKQLCLSRTSQALRGTNRAETGVAGTDQGEACHVPANCVGAAAPHGLRPEFPDRALARPLSLIQHGVAWGD